MNDHLSRRNQVAQVRAGRHDEVVIIRRERHDDIAAIRAVTTAAFSNVEHSAPPIEPDGVPGEATLVGWLREDDGWVAELSLVAADADTGDVIGHVAGTHGSLAGQPTVGVGPVSVHPDYQGQGVGSALMHAVLGAADALGEPVVILLGDPAFYSRFGFVPASSLGIDPPDPQWSTAFQARPMATYDEKLRGTFTYAEPFSRL